MITTMLSSILGDLKQNIGVDIGGDMGDIGTLYKPYEPASGILSLLDIFCDFL